MYQTGINVMYIEPGSNFNGDMRCDHVKPIAFTGLIIQYNMAWYQVIHALLNGGTSLSCV